MARILIVDDEPEIIDLLASWLRLRGYDVLTAPDGRQALQVAMAETPNLILVDSDMPAPNGIETCRNLRAEPSTRALPLILMGGYDPSSAPIQAAMAGADDVVTRPINLEDLRRRIARLLGEPSTGVEQRASLASEVTRMAVTSFPASAAWLIRVNANRTGLTIDSSAFTDKPLPTPNPSSFSASEAQWLQNTLATGIAMLDEAFDALTVSLDPLYAQLKLLPTAYISAVPIRAASGSQALLLLAGDRPVQPLTDQGTRALALLISQTRIALDAEFGAPMMRPTAVAEFGSSSSQPLQGAPSSAPITSIAFGGEGMEDMPQTSPLAPLQNGEGNLSGKFQGEIDIAERLPLHTLDDQFDEYFDDGTGDKSSSHQPVWAPGVIASLRESIQAILSNPPDQTLDAILNETARSVKARLTLMTLRAGPDSEVLVVQAGVGLRANRLEGAKLSIDGTLAGRAVEHAELQSSEDGLPDAFADIIQQEIDSPVENALAAPVTARGEIVGALIVANRQDGYFDEQDADTVRAMAGLLGLAIDQARLNGESQRRMRELTLLKEASAAASTGRSDLVINTVTQHLMNALGAQACTVALLDRRIGALVTVGQISDVTWPMDRARKLNLARLPVLQSVLASGKPATLSASEEVLDPVRQAEMARLGVKVILIMPVRVDDEVVGAIEMGHTDADHFFSAGDQEECVKSMDEWRESLSMPAEWQDKPHVRDLTARMLAASDATWCSIMAALPDKENAAVLGEAGRAHWKLRHGPPHKLGDNSLRSESMHSREIISGRVEQLALTDNDRASIFQARSGSVLFAPLVAQGEVIGLVQLFDETPQRFFTESDALIAGAIASLTAAALENAQLTSLLSRRAEQLEAAYTQLKDADRAKNEVIQNVTHELRTPLTAILGYADLIMNENLGPVTAEQKEGLDIITTKTREVTHLIDDVLAVGQVQSEPLKVSGKESLEGIARLAVESMRDKADAKSIRLESLFADYLPDVPVDRDRMFLVFENLLSNALKFSEEGERITLTIWDTGSDLQVEVTDWGIGIAPEELDKVWQRFYQIDGSATRKHGGTGIGLAVVKQVVEQHQGKVWVKSKLGEGSTFFFSVPKGAVDGSKSDDFIPEF